MIVVESASGFGAMVAWYAGVPGVTPDEQSCHSGLSGRGLGERTAPRTNTHRSVLTPAGIGMTIPVVAFLG